MRNSIVFVLALFSAVCAFSDDDLVANGSFEIGTGNIVDHWSLFIMTPDDADAPKAEGRVDDTAFVGTRSVMLTHPQPYKKEPYNNWSQQVFGPLAGKKLHLSGQIRTENASGASIWLQCWRKRPLRLLYVAETRPVTDTREWTLVETDLTVPEGTDFAMLRCVLRGKGTAWFDDVKVVDKAPPPAEPVEEQEVAPEPNVAEEIGEASERMAETVKELRTSNEKLVSELNRLQEEMRTLREQIKDSEPAAPQEIAPEPATEPVEPPPARIPILVPHEDSVDAD